MDTVTILPNRKSKIQTVTKYRANSMVSFSAKESKIHTENHTKQDEYGLGGALAYAGGSVGTGFVSVFENIGKLFKGAGAAIHGDTEYAKYIFQEQTNSQKWQENLQSAYNPGKAGLVLGDIGSGIGQSLAYLGMTLATMGVGSAISGATGAAGAGASAVAGAAGTATAATTATTATAASTAARIAAKVGGVAIKNAPIFLSAMGGAMQTATLTTDQLGFKEFAYGVLSGATEAALENISIGGMAKSITTGTNALTRATAKYSGSMLAQKFAKHSILTGMISAGAGEFVEEFASSILDPIWQKWTKVNPDSKISLSDAFYSGMIGFVSGGILGSGTSIARNFVESRAGERIYNDGRAEVVLADAKKTLSEGETTLEMSENYRMLNTLVAAYDSEKSKDSKSAKNLLGKISSQLAQMSAESAVVKTMNSMMKNATDATVTEVNKLWKKKNGQAYTLEDFKNNTDGIALSYASYVTVIQSQMETETERTFSTIVRGDAEKLTVDSAKTIETIKENEAKTFDIGHGMYATIAKNKYSGGYMVMIVDRDSQSQSSIASERSLKDGNEVMRYIVDATRELVKEGRNGGTTANATATQQETVEQPSAQQKQTLKQVPIDGQQAMVDTETGEVTEKSEKHAESVDKNGEKVYNDSTKKEEKNNGRTDEFGRLQEESRGMSDEELQRYRSGSEKVSDELFRRLSDVLSREVGAVARSDRHSVRLLTLIGNGNAFRVYENVNGTLFRDCFEIARCYLQNGELVDLHSVESTSDSIGYNDCTNYLSEDGLSGFSITPDGDLISVFNVNRKKGFLRAISEIVKSKAKTLDCFASQNQNLQAMYEKVFGFKTASVMDYNMEYDHDNIAKNHGMPQVAFMVNTEAEVQMKHFDKDSYDDAVAYQKSFIEKNNGLSAQVGDYTLPKERADEIHRVEEQIVKPTYGEPKKISMREKMRLTNDAIRVWSNRMQVWFVNAQAGIEKALVKAGWTRDDAATLSQKVRTAPNRAYAAIFIAQYADDFENPHKLGESLMEILAPVLVDGDINADWLYYQYHMLNAERRKASNDEKCVFKGITAAESIARAQELLKEHPEFEEVSRKLASFNDNFNQMRVNAGLISQALADKLKSTYRHYLPTNRVQEGQQVKSATTKEASIRDTVKRAEGSEKAIANGLNNYIKQIQQGYMAMELNRMYAELYKASEDSVISREKLNEEEAADIDLFDREADEWDDRNTRERKREDQLGIPRVQVNGQTAYALSFFQDGEKVTFQTNYEVYEGAKDLAHLTMTEFEKALNPLSKLMDGFKELVTSFNLIFAIKNGLRDPADAMFNTKSFAPALIPEYFNAWRQMLSKKSPMWEEYVCMGGLSSSIFADAGAEIFKTDKNGNYIYADQVSQHYLKRAHGLFKSALQKIENANILIEAAPRFAEYNLQRKNGASVDKALYAASEVTQNFGRAGTVAKKLNRYLIPFLTASIGGLDKQIRNITGIYYDAKAAGKFTKQTAKQIASLLTRVAILGIAPAVLGNLMYGDDDEYDDMQDSVKENNYLFKIGNTWVKLPKGRVQSVCSGLGNRTMRAIQGKSVDWGDYLKNVSQQVTPVDTLTRTILSPFSDVANNKTWYGGVIEDSSMERLSPENRYDESTSEIAIKIGQVIGYSPKKIHYLLDQYTGIIGDILLPMTAKAGSQNFIVSGFTVNAEKSSRIGSEFNDIYEQTMYKKNAGDETAYYQLKYLDRAKDAVRELWSEIDKIQASDLPNEDKLSQVRTIRILINNIYKSAMQDMECFNKALSASSVIEHAYGVQEVTAGNYSSLGMTGNDVGTFAVTYKGRGIRTYATKEEADQYADKQSKQVSYAEAIRLSFGAERAIKEYSSTLYEKASLLNSVGIDWETFYEFYFQVKYISGSSKKEQMKKICESMGIYGDMQSTLLYVCGYKSEKEGVKAFVNSSSLSTAEKSSVLSKLGIS